MVFKRNQYLGQIRAFMHLDIIKILAGIQRCGKSMLFDHKKSFTHPDVERATAIGRYWFTCWKNPLGWAMITETVRSNLWVTKNIFVQTS